MGDRISKLQFWEALEYSGHGVSWGEVGAMYETYKSKKLMIDISVAKTIREHEDERSDYIKNMVKQDGNVSETFRRLL